MYTGRYYYIPTFRDCISRKKAVSLHSKMKKRLVDILRFVPVVLVVWLYSSTHFFMHTHEVDGVLIAHSHIGGSQHQHSAASFSLIQQLTHAVQTAGTTIFALLCVVVAIFLYQRLSSAALCEKHWQIRSLRAPPVC